MLAIVSSGLRKESKSRVLAQEALRAAGRMGIESRFVDLRDFPLPLCDGEEAFSHPHVEELALRDFEWVIT